MKVQFKHTGFCEYDKMLWHMLKMVWEYHWNQKFRFTFYWFVAKIFILL